MRHLAHWIDGRPDPGDGERRAPVFDPAGGRPAAEVPLAGPADVDRAVDAAARAYPAWSRTPLGSRANVLFRFRELIRDGAEDLARTIVREHGKVLPDARGEVQRGLEVVEFA